MRNSGLISLYSIDDNPNMIIPLDTQFKIEVLSPSSIEIDKYIRGVKFPFDEEDGKSNPNANWLSTILKIYNSNYTVLLTSDTEKSTLTRIGKRKGGRMDNDKLLVGQVPHHGLKRNLNEVFWQNRKRSIKTPVVISVGRNSHKHPSEEVLKLFNKTPNYEAHRTDKYRSRMKNMSSANISKTLDVISTKVTAKMSTNKNSGDVVFELKDEDFTMIS
jgi:hypothetical protein